MKRSRVEICLLRLLQLRLLCLLVFKIRFFYCTKIKRTLRIHTDEREVMAMDYSTKRVIRGRPNNRILRLIRPLASIDKVNGNSSIVSIGCRYETDLLYLCAYGCDPRKVRGLDMISYSSWIDLGNMHHMDYPDNNWDVVLLGWVLSYSIDPRQAAKEILRVTRDGGVIAISVTYLPPERFEQLNQEGGIVGNTKYSERIQTVKEIRNLFEPHVEHVYFDHDVSDPTRSGGCMVIFSIKK
jgi:SAM-dependent methyltransferase